MTDFENEMVRQAKKRNCHTVVCGHVHSPSDKEIDGIRFLNSGDWVENSSFITYFPNDSELNLKTLNI
jgi:UDP-2,3-diacylglucosamine pyrophosphatase LpxH